VRVAVLEREGTVGLGGRWTGEEGTGEVGGTDDTDAAPGSGVRSGAPHTRQKFIWGGLKVAQLGHVEPATPPEREVTPGVWSVSRGGAGLGVGNPGVTEGGLIPVSGMEGSLGVSRWPQS
jgi:hypothetical protein